MDLNYLRKLIKIFDESTVTELSIDEEGSKLKLSKNINDKGKKSAQMPIVNLAQPGMLSPQPETQAPEAPVTAAPVQVEISAAKEEAPVSDDSGLHELKSPIVGTFYRSPSPESDSFVEVGSKVSPGTTLCIVEAMKLMNEIESDVSGTIEKILVNNSEAVEYNQPMFLIKTD